MIQRKASSKPNMQKSVHISTNAVFAMGKRKNEKTYKHLKTQELAQGGEKLARTGSPISPLLASLLKTGQKLIFLWKIQC